MTNEHDHALVPAADAHLNPAHGSRPLPVALAPPAPSHARADLDKLYPNERAGYLMLASDTWAALRTQCAELLKDKALHRSIDTPGKAMMIALKAIEMGLPLTSAWSGMRIIDGEVTILGKLGLRMVLQRAVSEGATCKPIAVPAGEDAERAGWLMGRPGDEPREYWFTMADAERACLLNMKTRNGEWIQTPAYKKYPDRMLAWRAFAKGAAYTFPDILQGCLLAEEMNHKDPEFIVAQEVEHEATTPSFHAGAPPRQEVGRDHREMRKVGELLDTYAQRFVEFHPQNPNDADMPAAAWYKLSRRSKGEDLCKRCVRGDAPTEEEARTMQEILGDETKRIDSDIANRDLAKAAEKAKQEDERKQRQAPGGAPPEAPE